MAKETTGHTVSEKLREWQERLSQSDKGWSAEVEKMNERESIYNGLRTMTPLVPGDTHRDGTKKKTSHVRNITFENIESQVSSAIPQPKVTPRRKKDEHLANVIEHFLRNELDRLPFEAINDLAERTVPIQGGVGFLVEWDNTKRTSTTVGEVNVMLIHPKQFAPQPKKHLEEKAQRAEEMQRMQAEMQRMQQEMQRAQQRAQGTPQEMPEGGAAAGEELPPEVLAAVEAQAQQDAMRAASGQAEGLYTPQ